MDNSGAPLDLLDDGSDEGTCVERGSFRLDWQRARRKIQDFKLAEPHAYVLELIQAAVAGGATQIQIRLDANDLVMDFDGVSYSQAELDGLFDALFSQEPGRARFKQLALGVVTGLGLNPKFLTVTSGDGQAGARLTMTSLDDIRLEALDPETALSGTRVHLRERMSWKVAAEALWRPNPEEDLLRDRCRFCPVPLALNKKDLRWSLATQLSPVARAQFNDGSTTGEVLLPAQAGERSELIVCMRGVQIVREPLVGSGWLATAGLRIRIDDASLHRNASHTDVQRDEVFGQCMSRVRKAALAMLDGWVRSELLGASPEPTEVCAVAVEPLVELSFEARQQLLRLAARALVWPERLAGHDAQGDPVVQALLDVPDLVDLPFEDQASGSLRPLVEAFARSGICWTGLRRYRIDEADRLEAAVVAVGPKDLLVDLFGESRMQAADEELARLELRGFNRRARLASRRSPVLPPGRYLVRQELKREAEPSLVGEVAVASDPGDTPRLRLDLLLDGAPLETITRKKTAFDGRAVIDCPALSPNEMWDGVEQDAVYSSCLVAIRAALPRLLQALYKAFPLLPPPAGLARKTWWHPKSEPAPALNLPGSTFAHARFSDARRQVDWLLAEVGLEAGALAGWVGEWALFWTLDGQTRSLNQIRAAPGSIGWVETERFMPEPPFGPEQLVLNLTAEQGRLLTVLGDRLVDRSGDLGKARSRLALRADRKRRREHNLAQARLSPQRPKLKAKGYLARVDLPAALGSGQAGVSLAGDQPFVRVLIDGLPLYDLEIQADRLPFCVEAVIEPDGMEADETFSKIRSKRDRRMLRQAVVDAVPALLSALAAEFIKVGDLHRAREIEERIWTALDWSGLSPKALPIEIRELALVPTVAHGRLSLDELAERCAADKRLSWVAEPAGQVDEELLLTCTRSQADAVGRVLGMAVRNRTRAYRRKLAAAKRRQGPRKQPILTEHAGPKVSLDGRSGFLGELGFPAELLAPGPGSVPKARVLLMVDGRAVNRVATHLEHLPAVGVIDSTRFQVSEDWTRVEMNAVWREARKVLRAAAAELIAHSLDHISKRGPFGAVAPSVCQALQAVCKSRFADAPPADPAGLDPAARALAEGCFWPMPDDRRVSLAEIAAYHQKTGRVWIVKGEEGSLPEQRIMVTDLNGMTQTALKAIFGKDVKNGHKIFGQEQARQRRKLRRPLVETSPPTDTLLTSAAIRLGEPDEGFFARGYCGLLGGIDSTGITLEIGVDGHRLCTLNLSHPQSGQAVVDCSGLKVDDAFSAPTAPGQQQAIEAAVHEAMGSALAELMVAWRANRVAPIDRPLVRGCLLRTLLRAGGTVGVEGVGLEELRRLDLFEDLAGQAVSARDLLTAATQGPVRAVDDELPAGQPADGGLVVRADEQGLAALESLLGAKLERWDAAWRAELAWRHRDRPELVLEGVQEHLGGPLREAGVSSDLADASLLGLGPVSGRALVAYRSGSGWNVNARHPAFLTVQRLLRESQSEADWPDPLLHLAAAIGPALLSEAHRDAPLDLLTRLAERALSAAERAGVQCAPSDQAT